MNPTMWHLVIPRFFLVAWILVVVSHVWSMPPPDIVAPADSSTAEEVTPPPDAKVAETAEEVQAPLDAGGDDSVLVESGDAMGGLIKRLMTMMISILLAAEGVGRMTGWRKDRVAVGLGIVGALIAHGNGWIVCGEGVTGWFTAPFLGLIASAGASVINDKIVDPLMKRNSALA